MDDGVHIGVRLAYRAVAARNNNSVLDAVNPVLEGLRERTGETACFFRRDGLVIICVALAETCHSIGCAMRIGMTMPLHGGSAGGVLLAWDDLALDELLAANLERHTQAAITDPQVLREKAREMTLAGYAVTADDREEGAISVSSGVFDSMSQIAGAITVSGPRYRLGSAQIECWADGVVRSAEHATRMLGGCHPFEK